ncbi:MAG: Holliday junction resolvase RuvX [Patescibacteria group bacterium]
MGIDFGKKKVGVAIASGFISEPLKTVRYRNMETLYQEIIKIVKSNDVAKIVVGLPGGVLDKEIRLFGGQLSKLSNAQVFYHDETLSTKEANSLAISSGMKRSKRKRNEDAHAAAVVLQSFIDTHV